MMDDSNELPGDTHAELDWVADAIKASDPVLRLNDIDPGPAIIAIAAAGGADDREAEQIMADERYRAMLGQVWSSNPPNYPMLARALSEPDGPAKRLIDQVLLPLTTSGAESARRMIDDLKLWRSENGSLDWFTESAPDALAIIGGQFDYSLVAAAEQTTTLLRETVTAASRAGFTISGNRVKISCGHGWYGGTATLLTHSRAGRATLVGPVTLADVEGNAAADISVAGHIEQLMGIQVFLKRAKAN